MSGNPAYEQVTLKSIAVQENSAYSTVHTVSPPPVDDSSHVPLCANPAYRQRVTSIALQQNSAYSVTHTESVLGAQYENIAVRNEKRNHNNLCECCFSLCVSVVDQCLSTVAATSSSPQDVVPVSANPAYGEVAGIVLQENTAYSIAQSTSVAEYQNIDRRTMLSESIFLSVCG